MGQQSPKNAQIDCFLEMHCLGTLSSQKFAGLLILTSEINPENFRSISQRLAISQNNLLNAEKKLACKIQNGP